MEDKDRPMGAIAAFFTNASAGFDTCGSSAVPALHMTITTTIITTTGSPGGGTDMV
ncbi:hypothetical protein GCM10007420_08080 [Glycocaulis albus]|uniref:Uncharacterized protein n=2 Tax=Glycocaulis albus TaxID=1382801 RepID=A0ABQ1XIY2_9PROT|nr:hypothetical protein GCM10007420_08080 [Glycocaulis albus]